MNRIDSLSVKLIWRGLCARFVSLKLLKSSKTKRLRPQNGARLRALREQQNLRQSAFADQINAYMRKLIPNLSSTDMLTQSMVSDLELEYADLSVLIYPIKSGQIKKRVFGKNLPQSLPDSDSDWQSVTEADCSRFRCIQTPFGARLHG